MQLNMTDEEKRRVKKLLIIGAIVIIGLLLANFILGLINEDFQLAKVDEDKDFVYQDVTSQVGTSGVYSTQPVINLNSDDANKLNEQFKEDYQKYSKTGLDQYTYYYDVSEEYLSIAIVHNSIASDVPVTDIKTYVLELYNGTLVDDDTLLENFDITEDDLDTAFDDALSDIYNDEVRASIISSNTCNYNCFLERRLTGYKNIDYQLYVKNNQLAFYRPYNVFSSDEKETNYFLNSSEDFLFEL